MQQKNKNYILIVDDKKENLDLLIAVCKKFGHKYLTAQSGEESIRLANDHKDIGLVLMDVKMAGMDGTDAMKKIKESYNVHVIAVTGFASDSDKKNFIKQGFDDYISKPIDIPLLVKKINTLLDSSPC
ncbi:MAG: response regulator [Spirochaetes bacterium]|nr:response regulator [Spirochaetota bacterium]